MEEKRQKQKTPIKKPKYNLKDLKKLGHDLLSSKEHINNLPILLSFISPDSPPQFVLESLLSLHAFFAALLPTLSSGADNDDEAQVIYNTWIRSKSDEFVRLLIQLVISPELDDALTEVVLGTLLEFVKIGNGGKFSDPMYHKLLHNIVFSDTPLDSNILHVLTSEYFKYIDIRYFTYVSIKRLSETLGKKDVSDSARGATKCNGDHSRESMDPPIRKIHYLISHIPPLGDLKENADYEMWSDSDLTATKIFKRKKLKFTDAWMSFLRLPLPVDVYKEVLANLHKAVIPHLSKPEKLCDFLMRSYDIGGVVSVMALSGLFILMTKHGLEYPNFYEKLYGLLSPSIFMAKHRAKFFELLDSCLKSPLLPAYLAAAFAKKLSRLALTVPPSGSFVVIALIHNLLRRHPSINFLAHRVNFDDSAGNNSEAETVNVTDAIDGGNGTDSSARKSGIDHFDNDESDPKKSHALNSSLWEIDTLRHHYCPPVSRFVLSLENDLTVRAKTTEVNIDDFASGSYGTIFGDELRRRVKQVPLAFYKATPTSLFSESDFAGWTFKNEEIEEYNSLNGPLNVSKGNDQGSVKRQRIDAAAV